MSRFRILFARLIALILFRGPVIVKLGRKAFIFNPRTGALTPQMAGAEDPPTDPPADPPKDPPADPPADPPKDPPNGDAPPGDDADLEKWKAYARKHEAASKDMSGRLKKNSEDRDALAAKLKEFEDKNKTETERAIEKAREEAAAATKTEVTTAFQQRMLSAEIRARAAGKFANPTIALKLIDLGDNAFKDDGEVNDEAVDAAIAAILESEPYLKAGGNGKGGGDADLGKGKGAGKGIEDMTTAEHIARMAQGQK